MNIEVFGNVQNRIRVLKKEIQTLTEIPRTTKVATREALLSEALDEWLAREELLWKQRSRIDWLKGGDCNVAFFKAKASKRKEKKYVTALVKEDGTEATDTIKIMEEFKNYFKSLFSSSYTMGLKQCKLFNL